MVNGVRSRLQLFKYALDVISITLQPQTTQFPHASLLKIGGGLSV